MARCLVESAAQRGTRVVAIGRPEIDLEDVASVEQATGGVDPSAIVNAAAYTAVDRAESEPERAFGAFGCGSAKAGRAIGPPFHGLRV